MADQNMAKTIELVSNLLGRTDIDALGTLADSLLFHDSTRDFIASRFLSMQTEKLQTEGWDEDDFADFIALLDSSNEQFNWGDEELTIKGYARLSLNLLISSFKSADELTRQLFSCLAPAEYQNLNILQDNGFLYSYSALLATNVDEFEVGLKAMGIEVELNGDKALVPLSSKDDLMYVGGAEFSIYNWDVINPELHTVDGDLANRQEFNFSSGSDMDLGCWMSPDKSIILLTGQWGPFEAEEEIDDLLNDFAPYIVGEICQTGNLIVSSLSHKTDSDPKRWANLIEGHDFLHIRLNDEDPYLVVGWAQFSLWNEYEIDGFNKAMRMLNDWLATASTSNQSDLGLESTFCVTFLKGEPLRRFRDFCRKVLN